MIVKIMGKVLDTNHISCVEETVKKYGEAHFNILCGSGRGTIQIRKPLLLTDGSWDDEDINLSGRKRGLSTMAKKPSKTELAKINKTNNATVKELEVIRTSLIKLWASQHGGAVVDVENPIRRTATKKK